MSRKYKITNPEGIYFISPTVVNWNPVFIRRNYFDLIIDSLKFCQAQKGLLIHCYCIMPSHMHLIVSKNGPKDLIGIIRDFKKFTSVKMIQEISQNMRESRRVQLLNEFAEAGKKNCHNTKYQFWQQNNQPKELTTNEMIDQKIDYIHNNPVKAGLCETPESYIYSSANPDQDILRIEEL